jgi:hypothetical protein
MQFRCYTCKLVMHNGIPPLEALDKNQVREVGMSAPEVNYHLFDGTKFEGMSPYQFCTFCLTVYTTFPSMAIEGGDRHDYDWKSNTMTWREGQIAWHNVICNSCNEEIIRKEIDPSKGQSFELFDDVLRSRACILHSVKMLYPGLFSWQLRDLARLMYIEA